MTAYHILTRRSTEDDAVIGVVSMRLADVLSGSSQVTAWRPLQGGIGSGRGRVSVLLKPLDIYIPDCLRGWNIGTVLIDQITGEGLHPGFRGSIALRLAGARYRTHTDISEVSDGSTGTCAAIREGTLG